MSHNSTPYYYIKTSEDSGVLTFLNEEDWDQVTARFGVGSNQTWTPKRVTIAEDRPTDFVYFGNHLVCSERCWTHIFSKHDMCLEGLELLLGEEKYYLINVFFDDALIDLEKAVVFRDPFSGKILNVMKYAFVEERTKTKPLFRLSYDPEFLIVTDEIRNSIIEFGATGMRFGALPEIAIVNDNLVVKRY